MVSSQSAFRASADGKLICSVDDPPPLASTKRMALRTPACLGRAVLVLALLLSAQTGFAGIWLASLDGICVDEHGKPLIGTAIRLVDASGGGSSTGSARDHAFFLAISRTSCRKVLRSSGVVRKLVLVVS